MRLRGRLGILIRLYSGLAAVGSIVVAVFVAIAKLDSTRAAGIAIAVLVGLVFATLSLVSADELSTAFGRLKSIKVGGLGIELEPYAQLNRDKDSAAEDATGTTDASAHSDSLLDLKIRLEAKLTYLAKHVLCTDPDPNHLIPTFLTVGSLSYDGYLTREQAARAYEILGMREQEFRSGTSAEQAIFIAGATEFIDTVRIEVFAGLVTNKLRGLGWIADRITVKPRHRRDLRVTDAQKSVVHQIIPIFSFRPNSSLVCEARERLETSTEVSPSGWRLIVVPPRSGAVDTTTLPDAPDDKAHTVELPALLKLLGRAK